MDKKALQRSRITNYFLEASISIIKEEGLENLTTKKIGDKAGYSYATIYNYFENFNELICRSMLQIADECAIYVKANLTGNCLLETCHNFINLMVDFNAVNKNIYFPFLSTNVDFTYFQKDGNEHFIHPAFNIVLDIIMNSPELVKVSVEDKKIMLEVFTSIFHSAMQYHIILKKQNSVEDLKFDIRNQIEFIIKHYIK